MSVIILFCLSFLLVEYISWHFKGEKVQKNTQIVMCFLLLFIFFGFRDLPILNDLAASFAGRNEYISRLCSFPLLIIDDFGMERGTEYGLEQVYNVIDSRYRSRKPLIVTTNLTLEELQHPEDTAHARIYDRLLEMCSPLCFTGENLRKAAAQGKMEQLKRLLAGKEICL